VKWLTFVGRYVAERDTATMNVWLSNMPFDPDLFTQYSQSYSRCTRTFLTKARDPKGYLEPTIREMYEAGYSAGSRIEAVSYKFSSKASSIILDGPIKCCSHVVFFLICTC
jgi:hypothetical protein